MFRAVAIVDQINNIIPIILKYFINDNYGYKCICPGVRMRDVGVGGFQEADYSMYTKGWMIIKHLKICFP